MIVSENTLRLQDLMPAFLDTLQELAPAHYAQLTTLPFGFIPAHAMEDDDDDWWASEEAQWRFEKLFDLLDEYAPEGTYFGSHEGNGACFGFWTHEEEE